MPTPLPTPAKVYLVGAGPGDPDLITVRGVECLRSADLVLYDYLIDHALLDYAPSAAEKICLGHHHSGREFSQEEINARMIAAAKAGKTVVRLKGGDPLVFGRAADETSALSAAGVPYEIVPGVTAAIAAAACAEIAVTSGDRASAVAFITGHERPGKEGDPLDYAALADFPGTLVFYMGVRSAGRWSEALLARGKPPEMPVAIVRRCTWPDQTVVRCTLGNVAETIESAAIRPPALIIIGDAVASMPAISWFAAQPLFRTTVLVTRPHVREGEVPAEPMDRKLTSARQEPRPPGPPHDDLTEQLHRLGAEVLSQPAIVVGEPDDWQPLDEAIARLGDFDWIVFSSVNGVSYFFKRLLESGRDARHLGRARLAAIGPTTAQGLERYHLRADLVPDEFRAEALADALAANAAGRRFLLIRASRGREVLAERLSAAGAAVEQVVAYSSRDVDEPDASLAARLAAGEIDWITVSSSSIARSLANLFGENLRLAKLASISPVTSATLRELSFEPAAEATTFTAAGLVDAILRQQQNG
jgi:uroporphyrinogen III methyltransferase / synthase